MRFIEVACLLVLTAKRGGGIIISPENSVTIEAQVSSSWRGLARMGSTRASRSAGHLAMEPPLEQAEKAVFAAVAARLSSGASDEVSSVASALHISCLVTLEGIVEEQRRGLETGERPITMAGRRMFFTNQELLQAVLKGAREAWRQYVLEMPVKAMRGRQSRLLEDLVAMSTSRAEEGDLAKDSLLWVKTLELRGVAGLPPSYVRHFGVELPPLDAEVILRAPSVVSFEEALVSCHFFSEYRSSLFESLHPASVLSRLGLPTVEDAAVLEFRSGNRWVQLYATR